ncbi:Putative Zinc finger C2H2-type [Septoria linicola]|uniref:Zinc finger C2H2-type n=1 Tax=Septoria linicola TaxID=215465 RepID=A0A9Q9AE52_9PEZI|nr:putative Zinc finger C2H2-type [Septoria linicola]USW47450.1 Putative Zinc finger C2H2-type [Septoria linicola]
MATVGMMAYPVRNDYQAYPQHYAMYAARTQQQHPMDVGQTINVNPYAYTAVAPQHHHQQPQPQPQPQPQSYHHVQPRSPQASGSPTSDDGFKPSLPSISNLLSFADRPAADGVQTSQSSTTQLQREQAVSQQVSPHSSQSAVIPNVQATAYPLVEASTNVREGIPPPSALRSDSVLEPTESPTALNPASAMSGSPYYIGTAINNVEPADQRTAQLQAMKRNSIPSQANTSPYGTARYTSSPYANSPTNMSAPAYYSPQPGFPMAQGIYQQRPLPSNFPPAPPAVQVQSSAPLPTSNPWEHHHYISSSSQATFPQSQDRYICTTCNKAFSRPSSLKIHTHSHTGEKPFRCPHNGCGKAFSVRSNMKRHERGCHSGMAAPPHMI